MMQFPDQCRRGVAQVHEVAEAAAVAFLRLILRSASALALTKQQGGDSLAGSMPHGSL
jgi:hypothetical protein